MRLTRIIALLVALAGSAWATTVTGLIEDAFGSPVTGTIEIRWDSFVQPSGALVARGSRFVRLSSGAFSVDLAPNVGSTPPGTSYRVRIEGRGIRAVETWVVPDSPTPVDVSTVRTSTPPVPTAVISLNQLFSTGAANGDVLTFNGNVPEWVPPSIFGIQFDDLSATAPVLYDGAGVFSLDLALWGLISDKPATFPPSAHNHAAAEITSGTLGDARVASTNVTQYEGLLSVGWAQLAGVPSTFAPSAHNHAAGDITTGTLGDTRVDGSLEEDEINHDNLLGFVADEHVPHSGVSITAGAGLTGGGPISANVPLAVLSSESGFIAHLGSGDLACGSGTAGQVAINDADPMQFCDGAATPLQRFVAYGNTLGEGLAAAPNSVALIGDTTGNFVETLTEGANVTITGADGEGASKGIAVNAFPWAGLTGVPATFAPTAHGHAAEDLTSGVLPDARVTTGNVTQHEAALAIDWAQLTGVPSTFAPSSHSHDVSDDLNLTTDGLGLELVGDQLQLELSGPTLAKAAGGLSVSTVAGVAGADEDDLGDDNLAGLADVTAKSGNTTVVATTSGSFVDGNCRETDADGNAVDAGAPCGSGGGGYATIEDEGVAVAQETVVNFIGGGIDCTPGTGETVCEVLAVAVGLNHPETFTSSRDDDGGTPGQQITISGATHGYGHANVIPIAYETSGADNVLIEPEGHSVDPANFAVTLTFASAIDGLIVINGGSGGAGGEWTDLGGALTPADGVGEEITIGTVTAVGKLTVVSEATSQIPVVVDAPSGQSAAASEWRVDGAAVARITAAGAWQGNIGDTDGVPWQAGNPGDSGASGFTAYGGDAAANAEPAHLLMHQSATGLVGGIYPCGASGRVCDTAAAPSADSTNYHTSVLDHGHTATATATTSLSVLASVHLKGVDASFVGYCLDGSGNPSEPEGYTKNGSGD